MTNNIKPNISIIQNCVDPVHMTSEKAADQDTHIFHSASKYDKLKLGTIYG